jgi:Na+/H+-dicarboxylate symporter
MKKVSLHIQIFIAMVLGVVVGALFPVDDTSVVVGRLDRTELTVDFDSCAAGSLVFRSAKQLSEGWKKEKFSSFVAYSAGSATVIKDVASVEPASSPAAMLKPVGTVFLNLLKMVAVPLVLGSLIVGAASLGDIRSVARLGGRTLAIYVGTTAVAISIGLAVANVIRPGSFLPPQVAASLMAANKGSVVSVGDSIGFDVVAFFVDSIPTNIFASLASASMLHIVVFSVFFGVCLTLVQEQFRTPVLQFFSGLSEVSIKMVDLIMMIAPYGVFALLASAIATFGIDVLQTLVWYVASVVLGLALHMAVVYGGLFAVLAKIPFRDFVRAIQPAQLLAFSTSSSAATLPVSIECVEKAGVSPKVASFALPLGATINMDGTALYQGVATIFIAQVYGIDLSFAQQLTVVLTATLASIGTAPVPGVGLVMLIIVLRSVGLPDEGIALILGVDRLLDMCRTVVNVTGDMAVSAAVDGMEQRRS